MKKLSTAFCIFALLMLCAAPVFAAANWNFYGSARMTAFWTDQNEEAGDDSGLTYDFQNNSRLGATVVNGNFGGGFEFGINDDGDSDEFNTRLLYGWYNFSKDAQLLVGQMYTPTCTFISNQVFMEDVNFLFFAPAYNGRRGMIQFKYDGLKIALVKQHAQAVLSGAPAGSELDTTFPKIEASYTFATKAFWMTVYGGYQTYEMDSATLDYDVDAYLLGITGGVNMGPAYIRAGVFTTKNPGVYGVLTRATYTGSNKPVIEGGEIKDSSAIGSALVVGVKATENVKFEAGLGYIVDKHDRAAAIDDDKTMGAYLQSVITVGKALSFTPEIGYYDYKNSLSGADQGSMWYAGVKTQIDF